MLLADPSKPKSWSKYATDSNKSKEKFDDVENKEKKGKKKKEKKVKDDENNQIKESLEKVPILFCFNN